MPFMSLTHLILWTLLSGAQGFRLGEWNEEIGQKEQGQAEHEEHQQEQHRLGRTRVVRLSEEEEMQRRSRHMSLVDAEEALLDACMRAVSSARGNSSSLNNTDTVGVNAVGNSENDTYANLLDPNDRDDFMDAMAQTEEEFRSKRWEKFVHALQPNVAGFICVQLDIDLSWLGVPGLTVNLALQGGINYEFTNGCWGISFEASLGFDWGFKVLGYYIGVGVSVSGSLDVHEVPAAAAFGDKLMGQRNMLLYAPAGANLERCHTQSPWSIIQAFVELEYRRVFSSKDVQADIADAVREEADPSTMAEFLQKYTALINGTIVVANESEASEPSINSLSSQKTSGQTQGESASSEQVSVHAPTLLSPAGAFEKAMHNFVSTVPAYAAQVFGRLVDNTDRFTGTDRSGMLTRGKARLVASTGRYLARWPTSHEYKEMQDCADCDAPAGMRDFSGSKTDSRVMNFAKVMRLSKHAGKPRFWKETALSAGNLLIRVLGDIKSLFATVFAQDSHWDGSCASLKSSFMVGDHPDPKAFLSYPWASSGLSEERQTEFLKRLFDSHGRPIDDAQRISKPWPHAGELELFPHLWCVLLKQAPARTFLRDGDERADLEKLARTNASLKVSIQQACSNVATYYDKVENEDVVQWSEQEQHFSVRRHNATVGHLVHGYHKEGAPERKPLCRWCITNKGLRLSNKDASIIHTEIWPSWATRIAQANGYRVALKRVETRTECERVYLPVSFVRMFPRFVASFQVYAAKVEEFLFDINLCLDEVGFKTADWDQSQHPKPEECSSYKGMVEYVMEKAQSTVLLVRKVLIHLGAADPQHDKQSTQTYKPGVLPLTKSEKDALEISRLTLPGLAQVLLNDFHAALGLGPLRKRAVAFASPVAVLIASRVASERTASPETERKLVGWFWQHVPGLRARLLHVADPCNRVVAHPISQRRPLLEYVSSLVITVQLSNNAFCTMSTAPLEITAVKHLTYQSWTDVVKKDKCMIGRIRPGGTFVEIKRCVSTKGKEGFEKPYAEWRIRLWSTIFTASVGSGTNSLNVLGAGTQGSFFDAMMSTSALLGGAVTTKLFNQFGAATQNHTFTRNLLFWGAGTGPTLGTIAVGAYAAGLSGFKKTCEVVLKHLAVYDGVSKTAPQELTDIGFQAGVAVYVFASSVLREHQVTITDGPGRFGPGTTKDVRVEQFLQLHIINRNNAAMAVPLPSIGKITIFAKLQLDWDLTPWLEMGVNQVRLKQTQKRQLMCRDCLASNQSFCDWKKPLGSLWEAETMDVCLPATIESSIGCTQDVGLSDHDGKPIRANYYDPKEGTAVCLNIEMDLANSQFRKRDRVQRYFRRH